MFSVGDVVLLSRNQEQTIGEVEGVASLPFVTLYDVSLEHEVAKGVFERDLRAVTAQELRAYMGWLSMDPSIMEEARSTDELSRRLYLRKRYLDGLQDRLDRLERRDQGDAAACGQTAFSRNDRVAVRDAEGMLFGVVAGVRASRDAISYSVDVMGETRTFAQEALCPLAEASDARSRFSLGQRVRFLVPGSEEDEEYAATVCGIWPAEHDATYSIAFDDGDILEDLRDDDLAAL